MSELEQMERHMDNLEEDLANKENAIRDALQAIKAGLVDEATEYLEAAFK